MSTVQLKRSSCPTSSLDRWGNWGLQRENALPSASQLGCGPPGSRVHIWCSYDLFPWLEESGHPFFWVNKGCTQIYHWTLLTLFCRTLAISPPLQPVSPPPHPHTFFLFSQSFGAKIKLVVLMIFKSSFSANCEYQRTLVPLPAILGTFLLTFKFRNVSFYISKKS